MKPGPALRLLPVVIIAAVFMLGFRIQVVVKDLTHFGSSTTIEVTQAAALAQAQGAAPATPTSAPAAAPAAAPATPAAPSAAPAAAPAAEGAPAEGADHPRPERRSRRAHLCAQLRFPTVAR